MPIGMDLGVNGIDQAVSLLGRLEAELGASDAMAKEFGSILEGRVKASFGSAKAPEFVGDNASQEAKDAAGQSWVSLAKATMRRRRGDGSKANILRDNGALKRSINSVVGGGAVTVGTGVFYGLYHQMGAKREETGWVLPARPFLGINESDRKRCVAVVLDHIRAALGA